MEDCVMILRRFTGERRRRRKQSERMNLVICVGEKLDRTFVFLSCGVVRE